jgi:hypothetical protein
MMSSCRLQTARIRAIFAPIAGLEEAIAGQARDTPAFGDRRQKQ